MSDVIAKENTPDYGKVIEKMNALMRATEHCVEALTARVQNLDKNFAFLFSRYRDLSARNTALEAMLISSGYLDFDLYQRRVVQAQAIHDQSIAELGLLTFDDEEDG